MYMNILFVSEIGFFPIKGGEKIRSYGLLRMLSSFYDNVYALTSTIETNSAKVNLPSNVFLNYHDFADKHNYPAFEYRIFRKEKSFIQKLSNIIEAVKIDVVFIDYKYYGQYIGFFKKRNIKIIYGTHNIQSEIILTKPYINFANNINKYIKYYTYLLHEKFYFSRANAIIAVSERDAEYYRRYISKDKVFVIPNFICEDQYQNVSVKKDNYVVMTGNFYAFQNMKGLKWFLNEVWDDSLAEKTTLKIAGLASNRIQKEIEFDLVKKNIEVLGELDDLKPLISNAKCAIVPILDGSGSRLKCIESMALKTQLISTNKGAEGIDYEDSIVIENEPEKFRKSLTEIIEGKVDFTKKAYDIFLKDYSLNTGINKFKEVKKYLSVD